MQSHIRKVYACLAVTCHLHFWQNDRGLLRATAVTRGWNGYRNKSQHRKLTREKKILPSLLQGFAPATFRSRVRRSNHWAIPAPDWGWACTEAQQTHVFEVTQRSVRTLSVVVLHAPFFAAGSDSAACLPSTRLDARWCRHLLLQQHCVGVGTHGHTPEQKPRCISMPVHRSSPCRPLVSGGAVVQVVTVVEGCHDAGIGSDPHRRGHGVQLRLSPASPFQRRSRFQWNFLCVGHSIRHKICYQVRLRLTWRLMEVELGVQIYPGGCPGTDVHHVSVGCQQVVQEHGRTSGRCRCGSLGDEWPATSLGLQLAHSRA